MSNTRAYRQDRNVAAFEAVARADRARLAGAQLAAALAERTEDGIAPIEPARLGWMLRHTPSLAWAALARMTERQLLNQAIETASWLETVGRPVAWGDVLALFRRGVAEYQATK